MLFRSKKGFMLKHQQPKTLSIMIFSLTSPRIMTLSVMRLSIVTLSIEAIGMTKLSIMTNKYSSNQQNDVQHNGNR